MKVKRVNGEFSSQEKIFFSNSLTLYLYEMMDVHWTHCGHHFITDVSQVTILYTLNLHSAVCQFSSVQSLSHVWLFVTPWLTAHRASLSITNSRRSLKLMCIESVMLSSHPILCCPLLLLLPIPPSIGVFSNESTLHMRWPKYWSFSFSIIPSKEHPGLVSFRMDWLDLLAVQGTFKSLVLYP